MNLHTLVGVGFAVLLAEAAFSVLLPGFVSVGSDVRWLAASVASASLMACASRPAIPVTLVANLHKWTSQPRRRRSVNELMRARLQRD